jgi:hypothetical protein
LTTNFSMKFLMLSLESLLRGTVKSDMIIHEDFNTTVKQSLRQLTLMNKD